MSLPGYDESDYAIQRSPGLQPIHPRSTPSPSPPPPFLPQPSRASPSHGQNHSDSRHRAAGERPRRSRNQPHLGDAILISYLGPNHPDVAIQAGEEGLKSESDDEGVEDEEAELDDEGEGEGDGEEGKTELRRDSGLSSSLSRTTSAVQGLSLVSTARAAVAAAGILEEGTEHGTDEMRLMDGGPGGGSGGFGSGGDVSLQHLLTSYTSGNDMPDGRVVGEGASVAIHLPKEPRRQTLPALQDLAPDWDMDMPRQHQTQHQHRQQQQQLPPFSQLSDLAGSVITARTETQRDACSPLYRDPFTSASSSATARSPTALPAYPSGSFARSPSNFLTSPSPALVSPTSPSSSSSASYNPYFRTAPAGPPLSQSAPSGGFHPPSKPSVTSTTSSSSVAIDRRLSMPSGPAQRPRPSVFLPPPVNLSSSSSSNPRHHNQPIHSSSAASSSTTTNRPPASIGASGIVSSGSGTSSGSGSGPGPPRQNPKQTQSQHHAGHYRCPHPSCTAPPFATQYLLNSHATVHSTHRPHFCPVPGCARGIGGVGFKRRNELVRHGLVHRSPGYACPFCPPVRRRRARPRRRRRASADGAEADAEGDAGGEGEPEAEGEGMARDEEEEEWEEQGGVEPPERGREKRYPRPDNLLRHVRAQHPGRDRRDPVLLAVLARRAPGVGVGFGGGSGAGAGVGTGKEREGVGVGVGVDGVVDVDVDVEGEEGPAGGGGGGGTW